MGIIDISHVIDMIIANIELTMVELWIYGCSYDRFKSYSYDVHTW